MAEHHAHLHQPTSPITPPPPPLPPQPFSAAAATATTAAAEESSSSSHHMQMPPPPTRGQGTHSLVAMYADVTGEVQPGCRRVSDIATQCDTTRAHGQPVSGTVYTSWHPPPPGGNHNTHILTYCLSTSSSS